MLASPSIQTKTDEISNNQSQSRIRRSASKLHAKKLCHLVHILIAAAG